MTGILQFRTARGEIISIEVDESLARAAGGVPATDPLIAKGSATITAKGAGDVIAMAPKSFGEAMSTLKAYAAGLEDLIMGLDLTPREVSVEIGLKMTGSAGFIIAKAGAETEMKVSLTWEPRPKPPTGDTA
jgi:hypothetical protein